MSFFNQGVVKVKLKKYSRHKPYLRPIPSIGHNFPRKMRPKMVAPRRNKRITSQHQPKGYDWRSSLLYSWGPPFLVSFSVENCDQFQGWDRNQGSYHSYPFEFSMDYTGVEIISKYLSTCLVSYQVSNEVSFIWRFENLIDNLWGRLYTHNNLEQ